MRVYVLMGVSGAGKTTIGQLLAKALGISFFDADDFHPDTNKEKMASGRPLTDEERLPWLNILANHISDWQQAGAVLACSALKESYRQILMRGENRIQWIYLSGREDLIRKRLKERQGHFMPANLLSSQLADLEEPVYGWKININSSAEVMVDSILNRTEALAKPPIGLIGLGVMGKSLALNMLDKGFRVVVYNRTIAGEEDVVSNFVRGWEKDAQLGGTTDLGELVSRLPSPRRILCMVPAGRPVDAVLGQLYELLDPGDVFIDGGNSHFRDTERRQREVFIKGIQYLGLGVSGGEEGALKGPSFMPGGDANAYLGVSDVLLAIAASDKSGQPCCTYLGPGGVGHYVKMVHNGIEYAEMQLLAEVYDLLRKDHTYPDILKYFTAWQNDDLESFLLASTMTILQEREEEGYVLDYIVDQAGSKGTGAWSAKAALEVGYPATMLTAAMFARSISSRWEERQQNQIQHKRSEYQAINPDRLVRAYRAVRVLNHQQGFQLLAAASESYSWGLDLSEIARIWTNGCIIRSALMESLVVDLKAGPNLIGQDHRKNLVQEAESDIQYLLERALERRVATPVFSAGYQFWVGMTTATSPANLIQAQRDLFGAHRYRRTDSPAGQTFHTEWGRH